MKKLFKITFSEGHELFVAADSWEDMGKTPAGSNTQGRSFKITGWVTGTHLIMRSAHKV